MQLAYLPVGAPTFDLVCAQKQYDESVKLLSDCVGEELVVPGKMLLSILDLRAFLDTIHPDLIVMQGLTFANAAFATEIAACFPNTPILLWTLAEPVIDGGRLRLNSLTGAFSAGNAWANLGPKSFGYVFGSPSDPRVKKAVLSEYSAVKTVKELKETTALAIGITPQGFGFGRALDADLMRVFGLRLNSIEARELMDRAKAYEEGTSAKYLDDLKQTCTNLESIPDEKLEGFSRLYRAYDEYCRENGIGIIASRCWPDFFTSFGTPVCAVLSLLNDRGVAAACEADIYGAVSMLVSKLMSGKSAFFGDPVSMDEKNSTITFWHCGMCPPSLACEAKLGVHPNRKIGPVMDFGCKAEKDVTIFRIGRNVDGSFRAFIARAEALDMPKQFQGASVVVKTENSAYQMINDAVKDGWEPHFVVAYADITDRIICFCRILGIEVFRY